jgi:DNA-binding Xre family transcriptional regulator
MLVVKLRDAMEAYRRRTGERMTYAKLAQQTGISQSTLRTIGSNLAYRPSLANVEKICRALNVAPGELFELIDDPPKAKRAAGRKRGGA